MFRGGQPNPYDEVVATTTDENLTGENWELILNLCDKVQEEGEQGARNVVAAILKRLMHRMSNVQLYTLTLAESLTKNCGIALHREIASRAFTQGLEKLITDRNTHDKVRKRALSLIAEWTGDFEKDPSLGIMEECYQNLKGKGYKFDTPTEPPPPDADEVLRRQEEEELQRVLEMSMRDKGGRGQWSEYSLASSNGTGPGSSSNRTAVPAAATSSSRVPQTPAQQPIYGGYVPAASPAVSAENTSASVAAAVAAAPAPAAAYAPPVASSPAPSMNSQDSSIPVVTRVRALHTFEPTEAGELAFEKGDIIKVVDRGYKDWWRGQLKGRTGIFPVNYVEALPEPTAAELAKEAEQEANVFGQAANVDRLLQMLRQMDPTKDNLADNEEVQELYRTCMSLRPKIVKLIDKYSQKRADLVSMNETFVKARTIFDRMMEDSLARHSSAAYETRPAYVQPQPPYHRPMGPEQYPEQYAAEAFGWNVMQPGYTGYPPPAAAYSHAPEQQSPQAYPPGQLPYVDPATYQQQQQQPPPQHQPIQGNYPPQPYGAPVVSTPTAGPYGAPGPHIHAQQQQPPPQAYPNGPISQQALSSAPANQVTSPPIEQAQPYVQSQPQNHAQMQGQTQSQPQPQPQSPSQPQSQAPPQAQPQPQPQPQPQQQSPVQQHFASQPEPQSQHLQAQAQPVQQQPVGPPFAYDPNATYPDPNVQAWAQYYAQGGTDPTGALYFISVPGVKEASPPPPDAPFQSEPAGLQTGAHGQGYQLYDSPVNAASAAPQNVRQNNTGLPANAAVSYGRPGSPYQPTAYVAAGATSPSHEFGNLPNQFAGLNVGGQNAPPAGSPGVGAPA